MIRSREYLTARIEQLGYLGGMPEVLESLLDSIEAINHRLDELELHHWQPPSNYSITAHQGAITWWTWTEEQYASEGVHSYYSDDIHYHTRLDCIRALKAYVESQHDGT